MTTKEFIKHDLTKAAQALDVATDKVADALEELREAHRDLETALSAVDDI